MAQIFGDKLLMFHVSTVDANTVTSADDGADVDLAAFPAKNISSIVAVNDGLHISFMNGTRYEAGGLTGTPGSNAVEGIEQALVIVSCTSGKEAAVMEDLWSTMNSVTSSSVLKFDAIAGTYPVENITGISVRRTVTTITAASDS